MHEGRVRKAVGVCPTLQSKPVHVVQTASGPCAMETPHSSIIADHRCFRFLDGASPWVGNQLYHLVDSVLDHVKC